MHKGFTRFLKTFAEEVPLIEAKRVGAELFGAPRLSPFWLFRPNELALSRIIADLLNPTGFHGQGILFLNLFLDRIGAPRVSIGEGRRVTVNLEITGDRGRLDILIMTPRTLIGIENKPWAGQRLNQLRDYLDDLGSHRSDRSIQLVFMSNQEPEASDPRLRRMSFQDMDGLPSLRGILTEALPKIRSESARRFVEQFVEYIDVQFGKSPMHTEENPIWSDAVLEKFLEENGEGKKAIAAVIASQDSVHRAILDAIGNRLLREFRLVAPDIELTADTTLGSALSDKWTTWGVRRAGWPINCQLGIASDAAPFSGVHYGVMAPKPGGKDVSSAEECQSRDRLESLVNIVRGLKSDWWPWYRWHQVKFWGPSFAAGLVLDSSTGEAADSPAIVELTQELLQLAREVDRTL